MAAYQDPEMEGGVPEGAAHEQAEGPQMEGMEDAGMAPDEGMGPQGGGPDMSTPEGIVQLLAAAMSQQQQQAGAMAAQQVAAQQRDAMVQALQTLIQQGQDEAARGAMTLDSSASGMAGMVPGERLANPERA